MDVHHFYHSVDRRKLIWMLAHKIKDKKYLKLTWEILQTCEQGLAIGFSSASGSQISILSRSTVTLRRSTV